jgi:hypothetical protein
VNGFAFSNSMGLSPAPAQASGRCCHLARPHRGRRQGLHPSLANKVALSTEQYTIEEIAEQIADVNGS